MAAQPRRNAGAARADLDPAYEDQPEGPARLTLPGQHLSAPGAPKPDIGSHLIQTPRLDPLEERDGRQQPATDLFGHPGVRG